MQQLFRLTLLAIFLVLSADAWGQAPPGPLPTPAQCQVAVAAVQAGNPTPKAVTTLAGCLVERGPVLSAYLRHIMASQDTTRLSIPFEHAANVRDNTTFDAAREIAADPAASTVARVMSLWVLINYEMPRGTTSTWTTISRGPHTELCGPGHNSTTQVIEGQTPLPADHTAITVSLADALNADPSAPDEVRSAASCLKGASRVDWNNLTPYPTPIVFPPVNTGLITLVSVCGNRFTIRNANPITIGIFYDVTGTTETRPYGLPPKPDDQPYSETTFTTTHTGTVRVLYQGSPIATGTAPGPSCTPPGPGFAAFLHGTGATANPVTRFIDAVSPTASTAKYQDSPGIQFSGGNLWKDVGTWTAASGLSSGQLSALGPVHLWLGLKNSDDQGTRFDVRVEVLKNGGLVAAGETYCIQGVTRNPASALEALTVVAPFNPVSFNGTSDVLSLRVQTRIGTNGSGAHCGGHNNAVGLRVYFDASGRPARFDIAF